MAGDREALRTNDERGGDVGSVLPSSVEGVGWDGMGAALRFGFATRPGRSRCGKFCRRLEGPGGEHRPAVALVLDMPK